MWRYADALSPAIPPSLRLTLGEGGTPLQPAPGVAAALGLDVLLLKREDLNPTGSHKDRGMAFQVALARLRALEAGRPLTRLALSSSGNAAIAAAAYGRAAGCQVIAFVAPATAAAKLARLDAMGAVVIRSDEAITLCAAWCADNGVPNLRPSTDPAAVEGFQTLGWELLADLDRAAESSLSGTLSGAAAAPPAPVEALFTFVSSATSLVGIGRAFERVDAAGGTAPPTLNAVQGVGAAAVAAPLDPRPNPNGETPSRLGALGARKTRRLGEAQRLIVASGGAGWVIRDAEADRADALLRSEGIAVALEGAAAVAAAGRAAAERGIRRAVAVLTGADRALAVAANHGSTPTAADARTVRRGESTAATPDDVDRVIAAHGRLALR